MLHGEKILITGPAGQIVLAVAPVLVLDGLGRSLTGPQPR
jgi:hypothetical protein